MESQILQNTFSIFISAIFRNSLQVMMILVRFQQYLKHLVNSVFELSFIRVSQLMQIFYNEANNFINKISSLSKWKYSKHLLILNLQNNKITSIQKLQRINLTKNIKNFSLVDQIENKPSTNNQLQSFQLFAKLETTKAQILSTNINIQHFVVQNQLIVNLNKFCFVTFNHEIRKIVIISKSFMDYDSLFDRYKIQNCKSKFCEKSIKLIYINQIMNIESHRFFLHKYQILLSQCLSHNNKSIVYKAIQKQSGQHFVIKTFHAQQKLYQTIQKCLMETRYLLKQNNKQNYCEAYQPVQWSKQYNIVCIARPFIYGNNIHDSIMKNSQNIFKIVDLPYFVNKYHELICKSFSSNFFPTLKNIYINGDKLEQNYISFTNILFLKQNIPISKNQYCDIFPYLKSDIFILNKQQKEKFLKVQCKIRSLLIFLISYMTGKKINFLQFSKLPEIVDIKKNQLDLVQKQVKQKWKFFLNNIQNKIVFQQYGHIFKRDKGYFIQYFQNVLVNEEQIQESQLVNQGFFNFVQIKQKKNKKQYKIKEQSLAFIKQINQKIDKGMRNLQSFMQKQQHCRFQKDYKEQSVKTYIQRQLKLNPDLLNEFQKWHNFCLVDLQDQTQQIKLSKLKIVQKLNELILKKQQQLSKQIQNCKKINNKTSIEDIQNTIEDSHKCKRILSNSRNYQIAMKRKKVQQNKMKNIKYIGYAKQKELKLAEIFYEKQNNSQSKQQNYNSKCFNNSISTDCDTTDCESTDFQNKQFFFL